MNPPEYIIRTTRVSVLPPDEPLFSERCTHITIVDEAAGEFLEVEQQSGSDGVKRQTIQISPDEWPVLKQAIEKMMTELVYDALKP